MKFKVITEVEYADDLDVCTVTDKLGYASTLCLCRTDKFDKKLLSKNAEVKIKSSAVDCEEVGFICPYDNEIEIVPKKDYWKVTVTDVSRSAISCSTKNKNFTVFIDNLNFKAPVNEGDVYILSKNVIPLSKGVYAPMDCEFYKA